MTAVESKLGIYSTKIKHNRPKYIVHILLSGIGYFVTIHITYKLHFTCAVELVLKIILSSYMYSCLNKNNGNRIHQSILLFDYV